MRQLVTAIRLAMRGKTLDTAAALAGCSPNTLSRVLRGENTNVLTAARIAENLGGRLDIRFVDEKNTTSSSV